MLPCGALGYEGALGCFSWTTPAGLHNQSCPLAPHKDKRQKQIPPPGRFFVPHPPTSFVCVCVCVFLGDPPKVMVFSLDFLQNHESKAGTLKKRQTNLLKNLLLIFPAGFKGNRLHYWNSVCLFVCFAFTGLKQMEAKCYKYLGGTKKQS